MHQTLGVWTQHLQDNDERKQEEEERRRKKEKKKKEEERRNLSGRSFLVPAFLFRSLSLLWQSDEIRLIWLCEGRQAHYMCLHYYYFYFFLLREGGTETHKNSGCVRFANFRSWTLFNLIVVAITRWSIIWSPSDSAAGPVLWRSCRYSIFFNQTLC